MAKGKKQNKDASQTKRIVNRRARHDYSVLDKLEVGIQLQGSEVKSIRAGQASLAEGYARIDPNREELYLHDVHIAEYENARGANSHDPTRVRKLLAHKREIRKLIGQVSSKGRTLVPLAMYFSRGYVKLEIGVCVGKSQYDKRQKHRDQDAKKEIRRAMTREVIR